MAEANRINEDARNTPNRLNQTGAVIPRLYRFGSNGGFSILCTSGYVFYVSHFTL